MTFTSIYFLIFVIVALALYYICPKKFRWIVLLVASGAFYCINCLKYTPFILFTMLTTYLGALWVEKVQSSRDGIFKENKESWSSEQKKEFKAKTKTSKRLIIALVLVVNFGILFILKGYLQMIFPNMGIGEFLTSVGILLPLGISFYTFQSMGYLIDVYRGKTKAQRNFAKLALFVSFFPQIIQGPIAIYDDLANQLFEGNDISFQNIKYGFQLVLWGLVKKMIIADRAVLILNVMLAHRAEYGGWTSLASLLIYALQLYADFSGGIDMARGVAEMFGITMAENFRRPYFSRSLGEYWRRWHITLGTWLKNYLFYPIAMSSGFFKLGKKTKKVFGSHIGKELPGAIATLITFIVIGIWHGANWKYVGFGLWNGLILFAAALLKPVFIRVDEKLHINTDNFFWKLWQMFRTFLLILVGYAFDIALNFSDGLDLIGSSIFGFAKSATGAALSFAEVSSKVSAITGLTKYDFALILLGLVIMIIVSVIQEKTKKSLRVQIDSKRKWLTWALMFAAVLAVAILGRYLSGMDVGNFVYMQF